MRSAPAESPTPSTPRAGKIAMQILHAGRYGYHPLQRRALAHQVARSTPFTPRALTDRGVDGRSAAFAARRALAPRGRLRRRRDHGLRGLPHQPVPRRAHQPAHRRLGRERRERGCASPSRSSRRGRARPSGADFIVIYRISLHRPRRGTARAGTRSWRSPRRLEAAGATLLNSGIGWHEARVPTIVDLGAARRVHLASPASCAPHVGDPGRRLNRINTPEVAEAILARGDADLVSMARPFLADPDFVAKAAAGRADEINTVHRLQPGLPRPHLLGQARHLPGQPARGPRDRARPRADPRAPSASPSSAPGPPGLAAATVPRPSAATRSTLFEAGGEIGGQFNLATRDPGQGGVRRDAPLLPHASRADRRRPAPRRPAPRPTTSPAFDDVVLATGVAAARPGDRRASTTRRSSPTPTSSRGAATAGERVAVIGAGGIGFDVCEFLAPRRVADARPRRVAARVGRRRPAPTPGGLDPGRSPRRRRGRCTCSSASPEARRGPGQDHRLGPPRLRSRSGVRADRRRHLRADRRRGPAHHASTAQPRVARRRHVVVCAGQEPVRDLVDGSAPRACRPRHRRRRRRRRARREARDRAGHRARRPALSGGLLRRCPCAP